MSGPQSERAVVWAAVSSRPQAEKDSIEDQIADAKRLAERQGWQVVDVLIVPGESREYIQLSDAIAGMDAELRPGERNPYRRFAELMDARAADVLICRARDRLGRTDSLIATVEEYARRAGCQVYSMQMPATGRSDSDLYLAAIERAGAQREMVELRRRTFRGMNARARKGHVVGSLIPFGYREEYRQENGRPVRYAVVDEEQAEAYRWAVQMTLSRQMIQEDIARRLRVLFPERAWTDGGVRYMLRNPFYTGIIRRQATGPDGQVAVIEAPGQHEALIESEKWEELQRYLDVRAQGRRPPTISMWAGLLRCGYCGGPMYANRMSSGWAPDRRYLYYYCGRHRRNNSVCVSNAVRVEEVTAGVVAYLQGLYEALADDVTSELVRRDGEEAEPADLCQMLRQQLAAVQSRRDRLVLLFETGRLDFDRYDSRDGELATEMDAIEAQLRQAEAEAADLARRRASVDALAKLLPDFERLLDVDPVEANAHLRSIFQEIHIKDRQVVSVRM